MSTKRSATNVDLYIGSRVRSRRMQLGISQNDLGDALGVTFQQIQKYEKGTNRVSMGTLIKIAQVPEVEPAYFYQGAPGMNGKRQSAGLTAMDAFAASRDGLIIAEAFVRIANPEVRAAIAGFVKRMSHAGDGALQAAE